MGYPALIGVTAPDGGYTARYLHWSDHPDWLIPVLQRIWQDTFHTDTTRMVAALLADDWSSLKTQSDPTAFPALIVAGVGRKSPGGTRSHPYSGRIATTNTGDMQWLYLIDPATDTVHVYEATIHQRWLAHSVHQLRAPGSDPTTAHTAA
jgi:hypothetical protein